MSTTDLATILGRYEIIDLANTLEERMPVYPTHAKFQHDLWEAPELGSPTAYAYTLIISEHAGTHVDATAHFVDHEGRFAKGGKKWIDEMPLEWFMGPCCAIDAKAAGPRGLLKEEDVKVWENKHQKLSKGDVVLLNFGWYKRWKIMPEGQSYLKDFPGLSEDAARYFVKQGVRLVGVDTIALEVFRDFPFMPSDFPAHVVLLENDIPIIENLTNLDAIPPTGAFFVCLPLKIRQGSGSPIRPVAFVPRS